MAFRLLPGSSSLEQTCGTVNGEIVIRETNSDARENAEDGTYNREDSKNEPAIEVESVVVLQVSAESDVGERGGEQRVR